MMPRLLWPQSLHLAIAPLRLATSIPHRLLLLPAPPEMRQRPSYPWPSVKMVHISSSQRHPDSIADCSFDPVRDEFETKIPELEANLSSVLGQPWKIDFDPGHLHTLADTRFAKESLGQMCTQYMLPPPCLSPLSVPHKLTSPPTPKVLSERHQRHLRLRRKIRRRRQIRAQYRCLLPHDDSRADHKPQDQLLRLRNQRRHAPSRFLG